jgi:hypothetical protein
MSDSMGAGKNKGSKMKGKNFSCNNLGQRKRSDFYETPYSMTGQLLQREFFQINESILEPACGNGAIIKVLEERGYKAEGHDLMQGYNFLEETKRYGYIITNPPFSLAYEFIKKAKEIAKHKFAFLLPLNYLHGKQRFDNIYEDKDYPLSKVYIFTRYPMLGEELREDGKYRTGMMVYAWFIWEMLYDGNPIIKWIDNDEYVLRGKE